MPFNLMWSARPTMTSRPTSVSAISPRGNPWCMGPSGFVISGCAPEARPLAIVRNVKSPITTRSSIRAQTPKASWSVLAPASIAVRICVSLRDKPFSTDG